MRSYLPESADSLLVTTADFDTIDCEQVLLRFRLETLVRLLFGDQIFIPEGWSLDSVAFLKVAGELLSVIAERQRFGSLRASTSKLSPFKVEALKPISHLDRLTEYLERGNCSWSGYPTLRDRGREAELCRKLKEAAGANDRERALSDAGIPESVVAAFLQVDEYLHPAAADRVRINSDKKPSFFEEFAPAVTQLPNRLEAGGEWQLANDVREFIKECTLSPSISNTSSGIRSIATKQLNPRGREIIDYSIRVLYMDRSSRGEEAIYSAPAGSRSQGAYITNADESLLSITGHATEVEFTHLDGPDAQLCAKLLIADWHEIWRSALDLTLRDDWRELVKKVRNAQDYNSSGYERALKSLERMLQENCPNLVLHQSTGDRIGLSLRSARAFDALFIAGVIAAPFFFLPPPGAAGLVTVGATFAQAAAPGIWDAVRPSQLTARSSSVFRLVEIR